MRCRQTAMFLVSVPCTYPQYTSPSLNHDRLRPPWITSAYTRALICPPVDVHDFRFNTTETRSGKGNRKEGTICAATTEQSESVRVLSPSVRSFLLRFVSFRSHFLLDMSPISLVREMLSCIFHPPIFPSPPTRLWKPRRVGLFESEWASLVLALILTSARRRDG